MTSGYDNECIGLVTGISANKESKLKQFVSDLSFWTLVKGQVNTVIFFVNFPRLHVDHFLFVDLFFLCLLMWGLIRTEANTIN